MQSRKWFLTLWNIITNDKGEIIREYDLETIAKELLKKYKGIYIIHDKEQDEKKHFHFYIKNDTPIKFETLKNFNKDMHIEQALGNPQQILDYLQHKDKESKKQGKHEYDINLIEGNIELESITNNLISIFDDIEKGEDIYEIVKKHPSMIYHYKNWKELIGDYKQKIFKDKEKQDE